MQFFKLKSPCKDCPFRSDREPFISAERVEEILENIITRDSHFSCHKTVDYDKCDIEEGIGPDTTYSTVCAGAAIMQEKARRPSVMVRIALALGTIKRDHYDLSAPVYETPEAMLKAHRERNA